MNNKFDYESIHISIQELVEAGKETDKRIAETNKGIDKLKDRFAETNKGIDKLKDRFAETNKGIDKLKELYGGASNNQGMVVEEEFYNSFAKDMRLGDIEFHSIERNLNKRANGIADEFDIVLTNSDLILIVEVKLKYHPKDVKKVLNKMSNFKKLYPVYKDYKIYGAIAGKILLNQAIEEANKYNLFVVAQEGTTLKLLNAPVTS